MEGKIFATAMITWKADKVLIESATLEEKVGKQKGSSVSSCYWLHLARQQDLQEEMKRDREDAEIWNTEKLNKLMDFLVQAIGNKIGKAF